MKHQPPLLFRLEIDKIFRVEEAGGVRSIVRAANLADHFRHFRKRSQNHARLVHDACALGGTGARSKRRARPDGAFIQMRQELGPDDAAERKVSRHYQCAGRRACRHPSELDRSLERGAVCLRQPVHHWVVPLANISAEDKTGNHWCDEHREEQRPQQRERYGPRHRLEQAAFNALQRENRQVCRDDDADGIEHRPLHFMRGFADRAQRRDGLRLAPAQVADDVLDHHHRALHHHAEIQRAQ